MEQKASAQKSSKKPIRLYEVREILDRILKRVDRYAKTVPAFADVRKEFEARWESALPRYAQEGNPALFEVVNDLNRRVYPQSVLNARAQIDQYSKNRLFGHGELIDEALNHLAKVEEAEETMKVETDAKAQDELLKTASRNATSAEDKATLAFALDSLEARIARAKADFGKLLNLNGLNDIMERVNSTKLHPEARIRAAHAASFRLSDYIGVARRSQEVAELSKRNGNGTHKNGRNGKNGNHREQQEKILAGTLEEAPTRRNRRPQV